MDGCHWWVSVATLQAMANSGGLSGGCNIRGVRVVEPAAIGGCAKYERYQTPTVVVETCAVALSGAAAGLVDSFATADNVYCRFCDGGYLAAIIGRSSGNSSGVASPGVAESRILGAENGS